MNSLKKQILSVAVATSTVLSCVPVSMAAIPADVQGTRYEEPVQILSALNIMVGDENGAYRLDVPSFVLKLPKWQYTHLDLKTRQNLQKVRQCLTTFQPNTGLTAI